MGDSKENYLWDLGSERVNITLPPWFWRLFSFHVAKDFLSFNDDDDDDDEEDNDDDNNNNDNNNSNNNNNNSDLKLKSHLLILFWTKVFLTLHIKESSSFFFFINFKLKKGKEIMPINERHIYDNKNEILNVFLK